MLPTTNRVMAFIEELEHLNFDELLAEFDHPTVTDLAELGFVYFEEVAAKLRERNPDRAVRELLERYGGADEERAAGILFGISVDPERDQVHIPRLRAALERPEPDVVAEAIDRLRNLNDANSAPQVEVLGGSPAVRIRSAVLRYLAGTNHPDAVARLRAGLDDLDGNVRANAVEELVDLVGLEAEPWVMPLAEDPDELVRDTVRDALAIEHQWGDSRSRSDD